MKRYQRFFEEETRPNKAEGGWVLPDGEIIWLKTNEQHTEAVLRTLPDATPPYIALAHDSGWIDFTIEKAYADKEDTLWVRDSWKNINDTQQKAFQKIARDRNIAIKVDPTFV